MSLSVTGLMKWGKDAGAGGTQEAGASGRPALPDPVKPDSDGGWLSRLSQAGLNRTSAPQQRMRTEDFHNWAGIFSDEGLEWE